MEITEKDGVIYIIPVTVYPKGYVEALKAEIDDVKKRLASGEQAVFDNMDELFGSLDSDEV